MLNIPSTVKALFQTDGAHKNFRVHFPNGEYADITNDNVVSESVKFTESLCSQNTFKFGLAEASVLEFETVGIGNMYGMIIEASCEIDCSSLSAADKATIAAGTWDGTWDAVNEVFAVPYGAFRVDSCPRNHGAMAHRQVTAYSLFGGSKNINSPFEIGKLTKGGKGNYTFNVNRLMYATLGWYSLDALSGFTKTAASFPHGSNRSVNFRYPPSGAGYKYSFSVNYDYVIFPDDFASDHIYSLDANSVTLEDAIADIKTRVEATGAADEFKRTTMNTANTLLQIRGAFEDYGNIFFYTRKLPIAFYPKFTRDIRLYVPTTATVSVSYFNAGGTESTVFSETYTDLVKTKRLFRYTDGLDNTTITIEPTGKNSSGKDTYLDAYNFNDLMRGWLELSAKFGAPSRDGGMRMIQLDDSSPVPVIPENYSECWWDEYDIDPIGTVNITFQELDANGNIQENTTGINIGDGQSIYDMTENEELKMLPSSLLTTVTSLVNSMFAPYADDVAFTPIELNMQGWPWMEAGDALEITAEDGTMVNTYALRIEMSGIQNLQSVIYSQGGEIIEEVS